LFADKREFFEMKAMILKKLCALDTNSEPLTLESIPRPVPADDEVLIEIRTCGVCHTELDEIEGRTPPPRLPIVPGHQVVGMIRECGEAVSAFSVGDRAGVAWIYSACGQCKYCLEGKENLCDSFRATGRDVNGGYAEYMTVPARFAYSIPGRFSDAEAAPLLCAGAIGYRSLRLTGLQDGKNLGLTGFGASGHLVLQMARHLHPHSEIFVFARSETEREFARELGAAWTGGTSEEPPEKLDAIIDTTPAWKPIVEGLKNLDKGGRLVINAIRKEDGDKRELLNLDYPVHLWQEKEIKSVANLERRDVTEFFDLAERMDIKPHIKEYALEEANTALKELKMKKISGAKVLRVS
jgi:propanol-preferring alcohol dehydrogenase